MLILPVVAAMAHATPTRELPVPDQLTAAKAIADHEFGAWRRGHPKAELQMEFADPRVTPRLVNLIRLRLGLGAPRDADPADTLALVFDAATATGPRRLRMDAYVFQGAFPNGFRARYSVSTDGDAPRVLGRTILQRYDLRPEPAGPTPGTSIL